MIETTSQPYHSMFENGTLLEVIHRNKDGRLARISKYLITEENERPIFEVIYSPEGEAKFYLYDEYGEKVSQVISFDKLGVAVSDEKGD